MSYFVSPAEGRVTSPWGPRPPLPYHYGIDIAPPKPGTRGHPVYAAYGGTVRAVEANARPGRNGRYGGNPITGTYNTGNYVLIDGPGGGSEWYGHLEKIYVRPGQKVKAGDKIGTMGASGNVTGIHLHFETWSKHSRSPHNPMIDFNKYGVRPGSKPKVKASQRAKNAVKTPKNPKHVVAKDTIRRRLRSMGYKKPRLLSTWVRNYQNAQQYKPGLIADGVWGPANEAHYDWVRTLQRAMKRWKGNVDTAIDGDYRTFTARRVREIQQRNHGGAYKGKVDGIPGPVFCKMLGIPPHPGL